MKQFITFAIALLITTASFGQKKELKEAEKALESNNFPVAISTLTAAKSVFADAKEKYKTKYYFLLGKAYYANGTTPANFDKTITAFNTLFDIEKKGTQKYTSEANGIIFEMKNNIFNKATASFNQAAEMLKADPESTTANSIFINSAKDYRKVYDISQKTDTVALHQSTRSYFQAKEYQKAIDYANELLDTGYTGISTVYKAKSVVNGQDVYYNSKKEMDDQVKLKFVENPEVKVYKSQRGYLLRVISKSYIGLKQNEKALETIQIAKQESPDDYGLLIDEANIYFAMDDKVKFKEKLEEATKINPNDASLFYNIGVMKMDLGDAEGAITSFNKAIELNPDYIDAYNNIGAAILERAKPIVEEMNNTNDFNKYDQLQVKQLAIYKEALPFFEKVYQKDNSRIAVVQTLLGIYENLEMDAKTKEMRAVYNKLRN